MPKFEPLPNYGDHMTIDEFVQTCQSGGFIDYDGHAALATDSAVSDQDVCPSEIIADRQLPSWATHVVWFNR